jgi:hypothetical protein
MPGQKRVFALDVPGIGAICMGACSSLSNDDGSRSLTGT